MQWLKSVLIVVVALIVYNVLLKPLGTKVGVSL